MDKMLLSIYFPNFVLKYKSIMDKTLRNTFIGILATIVITFLGAWIQLNSRIAVLEVQVQNDREILQHSQAENTESIKEMKMMLHDIRIGIQHLQDVKEDKK